jgi:hypothetical protein
MLFLGWIELEKGYAACSDFRGGNGGGKNKPRSKNSADFCGMILKE